MNYLKDKKLVIAVIVGLTIAVVATYVLNTPDTRTPGQKVGDAIDELHDGPEKALRQLEDRTPGEKLQDVIEDETEEAKKALNQQ